MQRMMHRFPRQGDREPWLNPQNYTRDRRMIRTAPIEDGALVFSDGRRAEAPEPVRLQYAASSSGTSKRL
jgi:hypothetical protein